MTGAFSVGDRVEHPWWGFGWVTDVIGRGGWIQYDQGSAEGGPKVFDKVKLIQRGTPDDLPSSATKLGDGARRLAMQLGIDERGGNR